jgi:hypothetical protein
MTDRKETTIEALARMMQEQEDRKATGVTEDKDVTIVHPDNRGVIIGNLKGDFKF